MDTVFFLAAKVVGAALKIETWLALLAAFAFWGSWRDHRRLATRASAALMGLILAIGFMPVGDWLLRPIEQSVPQPGPLSKIDGIIVLGGGEDVAASSAAGQAQTGEGGDRYLAGIALAGQHPQARLVFAGGSGRLRDVSGAFVSEAAIAEQIFTVHGIAEDRVLLESRSRNTAENARFALELADPEETWVLVTSAFHMPRALRSFRAAGWENLVPYPVDYRTRNWREGLGWAFARNLGLLNTALKEWVGRAVYAATGR